jgi:flavin reductase (DIM6/NTAB) family NADH-FMN oxidoreductase RutF
MTGVLGVLARLSRCHLHHERSNRGTISAADRRRVRRRGGSGAHHDAFRASAVATQASYVPLMISMAVNRHHVALSLLRASGAFALNVLGRDRIDLAGHFCLPAQARVDKLFGIEWFPAHQGAPILVAAIAYFDCVVTDVVSAGDHEVVPGRVVNGSIVDATPPPLIYADTGALDGSAALYPDDFSVN